MKYPLACDTWDQREIDAIQEVIKGGRYTMGPKVKQFEKEFCDYFNCQDAVMVNSGSTANLLILALLKEKYKLGGDIIVPAVSWSTTYFPVYQYGFKLNFVDIDKDTLNIDPKKVEEAITKDTCAIFAVNLLGNSCDYEKLNAIAEKHNLMLIEDNCESLGAINTDSDMYTGTIGHLGSFSFFFSHHLQTMEGGMVVTDDDDLVDYLRSIRAHGWVRDLQDNSSLYTKTGDNFEDSFRFVLPGYCVRPLEMSGAIGQEQLKKWPDMFERRRKNASIAKELFADLPYIKLQKEHDTSSWFGFGFVVTGDLANKRAKVLQRLNENGVETRPIVAGNFLRNPVIKHINYIAGDCTNADTLHDKGFFIGNDIRDLERNLIEVKKIIEETL